MNVVNLSYSNLANICSYLSNGLTKYTPYSSRSVTISNLSPFNWEVEIDWKESEAEVEKLIEEADVFHLNSWFFSGRTHESPVTVFKFVPRQLLFLFSLAKKEKEAWWFWHMARINKKHLAGKKILLHYHGGDLRRVMLPSTRDYINEKGIMAGLTIPDLKPFLNKAEWIPIPVPRNNPLYDPPIKRDDGVIKIVHAPTERNMKKSDVLIKSVEKLKMKYDVELMLLENIPFEKCMKMKKNAHISFDNIEYGSYAGCSIEAMYHEQASLVYLGEHTKRAVDEESRRMGIECPLVQVGDENQPDYRLLNRIREGKAQNVLTKRDYETMYNALEMLVEDDNLRKELGKRGRKWAQGVHDEEVVAKRVASMYDEIEPFKG